MLGFSSTGSATSPSSHPLISLSSEFSCSPGFFIASLIAKLVKNLPAMQETLVSIPGSGRSAGEGIGYPLQYAGLENSMDYTTTISSNI